MQVNPDVFSDTCWVKFETTTAYGVLTDTFIKVSKCTEVYQAQTVTMQSETRLGFKDYGQNYLLSDSLYKFLSQQVTDPGKKSYLFCN